MSMFETNDIANSPNPSDNGLDNQASNDPISSLHSETRLHPDSNAQKSYGNQSVREVLCLGDPTVGSIDILKQVHTTYKESLSELQDIGLYQAAMLSCLQQEHYHAVFVEGLTASFEAGLYSHVTFNHYHYWLLPDSLQGMYSEATLSEDIRRLFDGVDLESPLNNEQYQILGALGAACVYAILDPQVSLYRTVRAEDERRISALQARLSPQSPRYAFLRDAVRERKAMEEVKLYLQGNPSSRVALIYGALHDFTEQSQQTFSNMPVIDVLDWPDMRTHH